MTKTLTEQWREGILPFGAYYVNYQYNNRVWLYKDRNQTPENTTGLFEVLAPVPSYKEWQSELASNNELLNVQKRLEKRLEIATKALEEYADKDKWHYCSKDVEYFYTTKNGWYDAEQALKEMEGVK